MSTEKETKVIDEATKKKNEDATICLTLLLLIQKTKQSELCYSSR